MAKILISLMIVLLFSLNIYSEGCSKDTDCKGVRICEKGVCVYPASSVSPVTAPPVASPPVDLSPEETDALLKMKSDREIHLLKGRKG